MASPAHFTLSNLLGQLVYQGTLEAIQNTITLPELPEGVYLISIMQDGKRFNDKIYIK